MRMPLSTASKVFATIAMFELATTPAERPSESSIAKSLRKVLPEIAESAMPTSSTPCVVASKALSAIVIAVNAAGPSLSMMMAKSASAAAFANEFSRMTRPARSPPAVISSIEIALPEAAPGAVFESKRLRSTIVGAVASSLSATRPVELPVMMLFAIRLPDEPSPTWMPATPLTTPEMVNPSIVTPETPGAMAKPAPPAPLTPDASTTDSLPVRVRASTPWRAPRIESGLVTAIGELIAKLPAATSTTSPADANSTAASMVGAWPTAAAGEPREIVTGAFEMALARVW